MHRARGRLASVFVLLSTVARSARAFTAHGFIPEYRPTSIAADACEGARVRVLAFSATPNGVRGDGLDGLDAVPRRPTGRGAAGNACAWDLVVGGGGRSDGFRRALGDVDALAREVVTAVTDGGYDGVSYDWEYPTNDDEWEAYGRLLRRTRERLDQDAASSGRRALSFAVHVTPETFDAIEKFKLTDVVDWVHLMTYDSGFPSGHASLEFVRAVLQYLTTTKRDASKFTLGIPFYARSVRNPGDVKTYEELRRDTTKTFDASENRIGDYAFDSVSDVREKVRVAREHGFAGVMAWELGQDVTPATREDSLLRAIADEVGKTDARDEL